MSVPRFFKGLHRKTTAPVEASMDPSLSDASSTSSDPKDALGLPLPVSIVLNDSTSALSSSLPPTSAMSTMSNPWRRSRSSSQTSIHSSTLAEDPFLAPACPPLRLVAPSPIPSSPIPPVDIPSSVPTTMTTIPLVNITSPTQTRPPKPLYPPPPIPVSDPSFTAMSTTLGFDIPTQRPSEVSFDTKRVSHDSIASISTTSSRRRSKDMNDGKDTKDTEGKDPKTRTRVRSNALLPSEETGPMAGNNPRSSRGSDLELDLTRPEERPSRTRSRPSQDHMDQMDPDYLPPSARSRSLSTPRPVSILKNKPKSILRARSKSQSSSSIDPALRFSTSSDTSSMVPSVRSSLYLQQDPVADWKDEPVDSLAKSKRSSTHSQRRLSDREEDPSLQALSCLPPSSFDFPHPHPRSRMPPTPTHTSASSAPVTDHRDDEPVTRRRQNPGAVETSTSVQNRLSFPSLNDFKPDGTPILPTPGPGPLSPTDQPSFTPLTLKSVRLAKSRSKLRQEPHIGVATGLRRNSLPKVALGNSSIQRDAAGTGSPLGSPPLNQLPPLPGATSAENQPSSASHTASPRRNTEGTIISRPPAQADLSQQRRRENSSVSSTGTPMPMVMPRPILKDTSARDKLQRESWISEPPGMTLSGTVPPSHSRPLPGQAPGHPSSASGSTPIPPTPPKSLARVNSAKRQSKLNRMSTVEHDQDALTPRPRNLAAGYGPDYRPRRQSGGPGHLLFAFDPSSGSGDHESEDNEDSDMDESASRSKVLQEQYLRLQKSHLRQSMLENPIMAKPRAPLGDFGSDDVPYFEKRGQRKSMGDELTPPVPEKSAQRKRVSTMGSSTLPTVSSSLSSAVISTNGASVSAVTSSNGTSASASETLSSIMRSSSQRQKDRRPQGSIGANSLSFEPLFALKDSGAKGNRAEGHPQQQQYKDSLVSRLSGVSDADWMVQTTEFHQQGVTILDLSKRELSEIPSGLPQTITHLRLAYNAIRIQPPITSLTSLNLLQVLDLCDNQLETLPAEIGQLTKLKELYLSNNRLWKLPDTIQRMARLEVLDIRNNQFYLLNPMVGRLKALRQLDVRNNQLKSLPAQLCMLSITLTVLLVDGNQFVQPFSDLVRPLLVEDADSILSGPPSYLGDDPYAHASGKPGVNSAAKSSGVYEPWRRSMAAVTSKRVPILTKRRSHGDLMNLMGLQKKDGNNSVEDVSGISLDTQRSHTISGSSGSYIAAALKPSEPVPTRRERAISTLAGTPTSEIQAESAPASSGSSHPLSLNKFLKSIRKSSKSSLKDSSPSTKSDNTTKRHSFGSDVDFASDEQGGESEQQDRENEAKPNSKGSKKASSGGINQWMRDRFNKGSATNDLGSLPAAQASTASISHENVEPTDDQPARDSGYGGQGAQSGSGSAPAQSPELGSESVLGRSVSVLGNRSQNKSTGHLPHGSQSPKEKEAPMATSFDPLQRKDRNYRFSYMSVESQMTQDSESADQDPSSVFQQQQHRLSSVHSPTTPLPSSPVLGGGSSQVPVWNASVPRFGQSASQIRPVLQYLKDLYDLDPDSSEWEEVYAWRRVWNAERTNTAGLGVRGDDDHAQDDPEEAPTEEDQEQKLAKAEEMKMAKLQAQANRRRRIVAEIMATERTYVEGLKGLVEIYLTPALQIMAPGDHKAVFSNALGLYNFHANHFLPELEKAYYVSPESSQAWPPVGAPQSPVPMASPFMSDPSAPSSATSSSAALTVHQGSNVGQISDISTMSSQQESCLEPSDMSSQDSLTAMDTLGSQIVPPTAAQERDQQALEAAATKAAASLAVEDRIGRVFAEHAAYMAMYSLYINNYDNALRVLQTQLTSTKHKKKMKEFLRRCAKHPNHTQLALQGYLLLPVQRIPRYKLLLRDLLENTWPEHVDYQDIATALEKISSRADEMNERKRQYENHEKVLLVQNRIIGQYKTPLVQPHRKVVREGMLHLIRVVTRNVSMAETLSNNGSSTSVGRAAAEKRALGDLTVHHLSEEAVEKSYLFILFNDIMIQCNPSGGKNGAGHQTAVQGLAAAHGSNLSMSGSGTNAAGSGADAGVKNLELCRVLQLESRLRPAEVIGQEVLRVVDDAMVLYLTGDKDVIQAWKEDINHRW